MDFNELLTWALPNTGLAFWPIAARLRVFKPFRIALFVLFVLQVASAVGCYWFWNHLRNIKAPDGEHFLWIAFLTGVCWSVLGALVMLASVASNFTLMLIALTHPSTGSG